MKLEINGEECLLDSGKGSLSTDEAVALLDLLAMKLHGKILKLRCFSRENVKKIIREVLKKHSFIFTAVAFAEFPEGKFRILISMSKNFTPETELD